LLVKCPSNIVTKIKDNAGQMQINLVWKVIEGMRKDLKKNGFKS
jgi:hypothetical protein